MFCSSSAPVDTSGAYNTAACNYDDGDCCEETCIGSFCGGFDCIDPDIGEVESRAVRGWGSISFFAVRAPLARRGFSVEVHICHSMFGISQRIGHARGTCLHDFQSQHMHESIIWPFYVGSTSINIGAEKFYGHIFFGIPHD